MTPDSPPTPAAHEVAQPSRTSQDIVPRAYRHAPSVALFLATLVATLTADLVVKDLAFEHVAGSPVVLSRETADDPRVIPYHQPIVLVPHVLSMRLTTNTGAVFGLGKGAQWVFIIVSVLAVFVIGRVFCQSRAGAWPLHLSLGLILAGALGNLYDRVLFSAVRDMFWLFPSTGLWPWIFNAADAALMVGVAVLLVVIWLGDKRSPDDQTTPD